MVISKRFLRIAATAAIINAVFFFIYSLINLAMFAVQQGAVSPSQNEIIQYLVSNLKTILVSINLLLFVSVLLVYFSFAKIAEQTKHKLLKFSSWFVILAYLIFLLATLNTIYSFSALQFLAKFQLSQIEVLTGISFFIFGVLLFTLKKTIKESLIIALGVLYIIQGLSLISSSTLSIPVRLVDFTIAIRILEAVLFFAIAKITIANK